MLGKIDMNIGIPPFYPPEMIKNHDMYHKLSGNSKRSSEELGIMNYSYENIQGIQGLENKENINLFESHNTFEDKMALSPISHVMGEHLNIIGIEKDMNVVSNEKSRCN